MVYNAAIIFIFRTGGQNRTHIKIGHNWAEKGKFIERFMVRFSYPIITRAIVLRKWVASWENSASITAGYVSGISERFRLCLKLSGKPSSLLNFNLNQTKTKVLFCWIFWSAPNLHHPSMPSWVCRAHDEMERMSSTQSIGTKARLRRA